MDEKQERVKEKNNQEKQNTKKKSKKLPIIITIIAIIVIIGAGVGGYFIWQYIETNKTTGTAWGDTYYAYLKEGTEQEDLATMESYGLQTDMENTSIQFCEIEENQAPAMVMNYEKEGVNYVNVYTINEEEKVTNVCYKEPSKVEFLYNIALEQYIWYVHVETGNNDFYIPLSTSNEKVEEATKTDETTNNEANETVNGTTNESSEETKVAEIEADITIQKDEETTVEKVDGTTITLSKYDETFVKPEVETSKEIEINLNDIKEKDLKQAVTQTVEGYKTEEQIITQEVETAITEKVTEVENTKQEMEVAKEEKAKKEEEERKAEEARKAAEEAAKGIKAGNYTLKYGTYKCDSRDSVAGGDFTINQDGTFSWVNNWSNVRNEKYTDTGSGTYKVYFSEGDDYDPKQSWIIEFTFSTYHSTYEPANEHPNDYLAFDITANNTFAYRQSVGTFTCE